TKRKINMARKSSVRTAVKKVMTALIGNEDVAALRELLVAAEAKIARARGKGLMHANTASRSVSRLAKRVAAAEKTAAGK
ncbi:MAG: 30S ribosomal protein S20, partial [Candidatus Babeliales bacterium]|nr:30S ribosomal protein S20 [Candidatus Babeliales bacterium]